METAHNAAATADSIKALALRSGESGKPCKLRMRSAQARLPFIACSAILPVHVMEWV
jgi:hypothetical protein